MDKLYTSINSNLQTTDENAAYATPVITDEGGAFAVPQRIYTAIVPEKPAVLAEERIFVYVPKVTYDSAGIAKFAPTQFTILNGEVSLNQNYFVEMIEAVAGELGGGGKIFNSIAEANDSTIPNGMFVIIKI